MRTQEAFSSAVALCAIGAALIWVGTKLMRQPLASVEALRRRQTYERLPPWARSRPEAALPVLRVMGGALAAIGLALLVGGAVMLWPSR